MGMRDEGEEELLRTIGAPPRKTHGDDADGIPSSHRRPSRADSRGRR